MSPVNLRPFKQRDPITFRKLNAIAVAMRNRIVGGKDILVSRYGSKIIIEQVVSKRRVEQTDPVWLPWGTRGGIFTNDPRRATNITALMRQINALEGLASGTETFNRKWGAPGTGDGQLNAPLGIEISVGLTRDVGDPRPEDAVWVSDTGNDRIQVFNAQSGTHAGTLKQQLIVTDFVGINLSDFDNVFAVARNEDRVYNVRVGIDIDGNYGLSGILETTYGGPGSGDGQFDAPWDVLPETFTTNFFISDTGNNRVQFMSGNIFEYKWGTSGTGNGQFDGPKGLAGLAVIIPGPVIQRRIFVVDSGNDRVQYFDGDDGTYIGQFGVTGAGNGEFNNPTGISTEQANNEVHVADTGNHRIQVFDEDGIYLRQYGTFGTGDGQLDSPRDVAFYNGESYVLDTGNNRIQVFRRSGILQTTWVSYDSLSPDTATPLGEPDGGVDIPALDAIDGSLMALNYITDMRDAIESLAPFYINAVTGSPFNWTPFSNDNLYYVSFGSDYDWTRSAAEMNGSDTYDIDINEIRRTRLQLSASAAA